MNQQNRVRIIIGVVCGSFLAALDTTILATVLPTIVGELGGLALYGWVFSAYMVLAAVSMLLWGRLADVFGKKRLFVAAVGAFLLGSMLCGLSQNMIQLIIFRGIQGLGAGGLASIPFALISTVVSQHERGKALGFLSSAWGISSVIGPLVGSFIVMSVSWRWVFYINIPVGVVAVTMVAKYYAEQIPHHRERMDYAGALLLCLTIVFLLLSFLSLGKGERLISTETVGYSLAFLIFLILFIARQRSFVSPILRLEFFRRRGFWTGNLLGFLASFSMYGVIAFVPLFAQSIEGGTALKAGLIITPMSLFWSGSSFTAGRFASRVGERLLVWLGIGLMMTGFALASFIRVDSSAWFLILCVSVIGSGMGCQTPSLVLMVQNSLDIKNIGIATSTQMLARTIGGAIGVSVMGAALTASMVQQFAEFSAQGLLRQLPEAVRILVAQPQELLSNRMRELLSPAELALVLTAFTGALHRVFLIGLCVLLASALVSYFLPVRARQSMSGELEGVQQPRDLS